MTLKKAQLKEFKNMLLEWKERVYTDINKMESNTLGKSQKDFAGDLSGYSLHMADAGTDTFEQEFALDLVSNQQEILYQIDEALKRIEEGAYGVCECGKVIPIKRLKALPFARLCIKCQEAVEKKEK